MARLMPMAQLVQDRSHDLGQDHGDPTGRAAYAAGNMRVGTVGGALVEEDGRIRYFILDVGRWFPNKQVLVPVGLARIEDDRVHFGSLTREQVDHLNPYEAGREYTPEAQAADERVLRGAAYTGPVGLTGQGAGQEYNYRDGEDHSLFQTPDRLQLLEERLLVSKERVAAGQVEVGKRVETHTEQVDVPLEHEELVIERHAVTDPWPVEGEMTLGADTGSVRVELEAERADVHKQAYVAEEVEIGKRTVTETQTVTETVGREVLETEQAGDVHQPEATTTTGTASATALPGRASDVKPAASVQTDTSVPSAPRRSIPAAVLPVAVLAGMTALLLRTPESRAGLSRLITTTGRRVGNTAASAGQVVVSGTRTAARGAGQVAASVTEAAKPIPNALANGVSAVLSAGNSAVKTLTHKEATQVNTTKAAAREVVRDIQDVPRMAEIQASIEAEVERQLDRRVGLLQQELEWQFAQQDAALNSLSAEFAQRSLESLSVEPRRRRGGLPLTLLLLGGAGYALWRQPQVRQKVTGVFQQVGPQARDMVQRAEQAVRQRLEGVQGQAASPTAAQAGASTASSMPTDLTQEQRTEGTAVQDPLRQVGETPGSVQGMQGSPQAGQNLGSQVDGPKTAGSSSTGSQKKSNTRR